MVQSSGVLIVGHFDRRGHEFGAHAVHDFREARTYIQRHLPSLLVFGLGAQFEEFCKFALEHAPHALWILCGENISPAQIAHCNNFGRLFDVVDNLQDASLEPKLLAALEAAGDSQQKLKLAEMFEEQTQRLKRLSLELEKRVEKRHKALRHSLKTLESTKVRLEAFHKALLGIHRASSTAQMEQTLTEGLRGTLPMSWVRVRYAHQSLLRRQRSENILAIELPFASGAEVLFAKVEGQSFTPSEVDFLHELSDALALALSRLHKLEQAETLQAQWQATFDAIPHALCLTTGDFEILKLNRAFQEACGPHELIGKNCFSAFFGAEFHPPHGMTSPLTFRHARTGPRETEHFEIVGENLGLTVDNQNVQLMLLRSITMEVRFERRILESSKLAELGTIGSSIAHELNNPLGGMLSFLQLILMDLKKDSPLFADIKEMEKAVFRCRDIVLNLLGFARKQDLGELSRIDMLTVLERAVKLIELQSKSKGVEIELSTTSGAWVQGNLNALAQVVCNILQNSLDAIVDKLKLDPLYVGKIRLHLTVLEAHCQLRVSDNGTGIRPEVQSQIFNPLFTTRDPSHFAGMGLTSAFALITEHRGTLELLSQTGSGTTAIITFPLL